MSDSEKLVDPQARIAAINRFRQVRRGLRETAATFGARLKVTASTVHRWESPADPAAPSARHLMALCAQCDLSPSWLLFDAGPKKLSDLDVHNKRESLLGLVDDLTLRISDLLDTLPST